MITQVANTNNSKMNKLLLIAFLWTSGEVARAQMDIGIEFVDILNPGNPPDPMTGNLIGSVPYSFRMGKFEITNQQYVTFLNQVDPLGANLLELHSPGEIWIGLSSPFGQKYEAFPEIKAWPVANISYNSAMRFVNWLQGGNTEDGAYTLTSLNPPLDTIARKAGARFWIPNRNEWHKAAYYRGPDSDIRPIYGTDYSLFPMGGFTSSFRSLLKNEFIFEKSTLT